MTPLITSKKRIIAAEDKGKKKKRVPSPFPSPFSSECDLIFFSRSEETEAAAAFASAAASAVPSRSQRGYRIPPGQKFRYAARGYVYPTRRAVEAAAAVDAAVGEETTAPSPSPSTPTPTPDEDGDRRP